MATFAEVAVSLPMDRTFHYSIPQSLSGDIAIGKRVFVPFINRAIVGYVVGFSDVADVNIQQPVAVDVTEITAHAFEGILAEHARFRVGETAAAFLAACHGLSY